MLWESLKCCWANSKLAQFVICKKCAEMVGRSQTKIHFFPQLIEVILHNSSSHPADRSGHILYTRAVVDGWTQWQTTEGMSNGFTCGIFCNNVMSKKFHCLIQNQQKTYCPIAVVRLCLFKAIFTLNNLGNGVKQHWCCYKAGTLFSRSLKARHFYALYGKWGR